MSVRPEHTREPSSERTADADVETLRRLMTAYAMLRRSEDYDWSPEGHAALDRLLARNQQLQEALAAAVKAYDSLLQAERDDAKMGYPLPGDSCLAAAMGLGADETFEKARAALASVRARTQ